MTWRLVIFFKKIAPVLVLLLPAYLGATTVSGQVQLIQSKDSAVKKKNDYSGVVVWLTSPDLPPAPAAHKHARMLQKNKRFSPHILAVQTGTIVDFPNLDPIFHNAFSNFDGTIFDVALYPPGSSRSVRFDRPGIVRVFCNIHAFMSAIIVVVNSTHFTVTGRDGGYSFDDLPPGTYEVQFFHERATPETLRHLTQKITVGEEDINLGTTPISEAGYIPVAHKNKYGRDYPPDSDVNNGYVLPVK
ncbi:MAG TPA: carboxypeptidase regulatory-like domain-containing protein [Bryobacteraceae bacterium]|nr:carboxypeptidase regulatory-like domain-containing protein [Bryobacteraceae bacterium]